MCRTVANNNSGGPCFWKSISRISWDGNVVSSFHFAKAGTNGDTQSDNHTMIDHMHIHCTSIKKYDCVAGSIRNIYGVTKSNREGREGDKFGYFKIQLDVNGDPDGSTVYYTPMFGQSSRRAIGVWDRFNGVNMHVIVRQNAKELYYVHLDI